MTIENVMSLATVKGVRYTGGLIGQHDGNPNTQLDIKNTTFAGSVTSPGCAGGFVGFFQGRVSIENCWNAGTVTSSTASVDKNNAVGGFVGRARPRGDLETYVIKKCVNTGTLTGGAVGGIIGSAEMNVTSIVLEGCTNYGTLVAGENITASPIQNAFYATNTPVDPCPSDGVPVVKADCEDRTGISSGMTLPTVTPDYTKDDAPDVPDESSSDENETGSNTDTNTVDTGKETTAVSTDTAAQTTAKDTDTADEKGCGSVIGGGMVAVVLAGTLVACAAITTKKKTDNF